MDRLRFWTVQAPEYQAMSLLWRRTKLQAWSVHPYERTLMTLEGSWVCLMS